MKYPLIFDSFAHPLEVPDVNVRIQSREIIGCTTRNLSVWMGRNLGVSIRVCHSSSADRGPSLKEVNSGWVMRRELRGNNGWMRKDGMMQWTINSPLSFLVSFAPTNCHKSTPLGKIIWIEAVGTSNNRLELDVRFGLELGLVTLGRRSPSSPDVALARVGWIWWKRKVRGESCGVGDDVTDWETPRLYKTGRTSRRRFSVSVSFLLLYSFSRAVNSRTLSSSPASWLFFSWVLAKCSRIYGIHNHQPHSWL